MVVNKCKVHRKHFFSSLFPFNLHMIKVYQLIYRFYSDVKTSLKNNSPANTFIPFLLVE